ncbi:MAG: hypothetical protein WED01_11835 [Candidatus Rokuibacteriota bacterium]
MATATMKREHTRSMPVPRVTTAFLSEGRIHHARCRGAIDFRGSRGGIELDFYCRTCREHVTLPEHAVARLRTESATAGLSTASR